MPESDSARSVVRSPRENGTLTPDEDARWAALAHLGGLIGVVPSLVVFISLKNRGARTNIESKEALNWQVTLLIGLIALDILAVIVGGLAVLIATWTGHPAVYPAALVVGYVSAVIWLPNIALSILAFLRVNAGGSYRYPFAVRFIK